MQPTCGSSLNMMSLSRLRFSICKFRQIGEFHAVVLREQADRFPADTVQADVQRSQAVNIE